MTGSGFNFDNTYLHLPNVFYTKLLPAPVPKPEMVLLNEPLATDLGLDFSDISPGSLRIFPALTCVLDRLLYQGMGLEEAIRAARIHWEEGSAFLEGDFAPEVHQQVSERFPGPVVKRRVQDLFFGGVHAVEKSENGNLLGVADPRRDGVALGL